jgi:hypothetical protein
MATYLIFLKREIYFSHFLVSYIPSAIRSKRRALCRRPTYHHPKVASENISLGSVEPLVMVQEPLSSGRHQSGGPVLVRLESGWG